jgi:enoyl-CoA hydratase/carnithine racemase
MHLQDSCFAAYRSLKLTRDADGVLVVEFHSKGGPFRFTAQDHTEFVDGFTAWSYRAGAGRAEMFLLNPQPLTAQTAHELGVIAEVVPKGTALPRARELAKLYSKAPEVTRRNTRVHFIQSLKERIVREVGYGLSLEGASAADLVKSMRAQNEPLAQKGKVA